MQDFSWFLSWFLFLLELVLIIFIFQEICPFHLNVEFIGIKLFIIVSYYPLLCVGSVVMCSLSSLIIGLFGVFFVLVIFAFFLHQSLKRFISFTVVFFFFLINSWLYWYSLLFPVFYFVNSCSWLSYFFLYLRVFQLQCYWHYRPNNSVLSIIGCLAASLASPHRIQYYLPSMITKNISVRACVLSRFSCVWLFATLWTVAH